ncbi:phytanoyl-CoA dioxygenase family protein [Paenibacillus aceris]|uniref:Ectoine hydroxylase-related dioxygenase (Phytanoyl-CoA dioxygenase family) n=1 Tax=Paenibacillus aceris TaxID=869555 RepID=A0ABS4I6F5_9BACL|nr:phytanoyl-CoA dioxygenase family protein [Paenibacillus aceris]MBP1966498.1 ectoine hydroxylase-related dioxygenase (phytanoyl-CoA dioxygenase family) [Paenibacillus aceris]NHW39526.1 phytanoyl-CoA dioxygenase family protein [Paenibacillus aceris]
MNVSQIGGSLSKEQIDFYHLEGYLVIPNLLQEEDLTQAIEAMNSKVSAIADELAQAGLIHDKLEDRPFKYRLAELFKDLTAEHFLKYGRSWRDRIPGYFHLMSNPKILDAVESLIGGELFSNPVYNTRPKIPKVAAGAVPWHQDKSYWPDANSNPVITVWIPLVDANEINGCLHIKPRTHRKRLLKWHQESETGTGYTALHESQLGKTKTVVLPVTAGSAILFNDRCLHMSTPNLSDEVRWSVDLRYQPTDQDPMPAHGAGFLARSYKYPERVATLEDWMANRTERTAVSAD